MNTGELQDYMKSFNIGNILHPALIKIIFRNDTKKNINMVAMVNEIQSK